MCWKEKERERKMCEVLLSWQESIHYVGWLLKRRHTCCGFITKDGKKERITLSPLKADVPIVPFHSTS